MYNYLTLRGHSSQHDRCKVRKISIEMFGGSCSGPTLAKSVLGWDVDFGFLYTPADLYFTIASNRPFQMTLTSR